MEITIETRLYEFIKKGGLWSGGERVAHYYTIEEINKLEEYFTDIEIPFTDTQINDTFWFETETLNEYLGINQEEWDNREKQW